MKQSSDAPTSRATTAPPSTGSSIHEAQTDRDRYLMSSWPEEETIPAEVNYLGFIALLLPVVLVAIVAGLALLARAAGW